MVAAENTLILTFVWISTQAKMLLDSLPDVPRAFWLSLFLLGLVRIPDFNEVDIAEPQDLTYFEGLGKFRTRDLCSASRFYTFLLLFVIGEILVFSLLCYAGPKVLGGALKVLAHRSLSAEDADPSTFSFYVVATLLSVSEAGIPKISAFPKLWKWFIHELMKVPDKVEAACDVVIAQIMHKIEDLDKKASKTKLKDELNRLHTLFNEASFIDKIDTVFVNGKIQALGLFDHSAVEDFLSDCSVRELKKKIKQVVVVLLSGAARHDGNRNVDKVCAILSGTARATKVTTTRFFAINVCVFSITALISLSFLWLIMQAVEPRVTPLLVTETHATLWPTTPGFALNDLLCMASPPYIACLLVLFALSPRGIPAFGGGIHLTRENKPGSLISVIDKHLLLLIACFALSFTATTVLNLYNIETCGDASTTGTGAPLENKIVRIALESVLPTIVCLIGLQYAAHRGKYRLFSAIGVIAIISSGVLLSYISAKAQLSLDFFYSAENRKDYFPGYTYIALAMTFNPLICTALFLGVQGTLGASAQLTTDSFPTSGGDHAAATMGLRPAHD